MMMVMTVLRFLMMIMTFTLPVDDNDYFTLHDDDDDDNDFILLCLMMIMTLRCLMMMIMTILRCLMTALQKTPKHVAIKYTTKPPNAVCD
jgi:hypothetical protein